MSKLVAFDPAAHHVAWASFENRRLMRCGLIRESLAEELERRFRVSAAWKDPMRWAIELPQVYGRGGKGDPNDLIAVAVTVGRIVQAIGPLANPEPELVRPHRWKGSVLKKVMLDRIVKRLDADEAIALHTTNVPASLKHNVIDAIGLGLHCLGRLR